MNSSSSSPSDLPRRDGSKLPAGNSQRRESASFYYAPVTTDVVMHSYPPRRRIWTALLLPALATAMTFFVTLVMVYWLAPLKGDPSDLEAMRRWEYSLATTRMGVCLLLLPTQMVFLAAVTLGARMSDESFAKRLGIVRGALPIWNWGMFVLATPVIGIVTSLLLAAAFPEPSRVLKLLETIFRVHTGPFFVVVLLLASVIPGTVEELMFRGYLQKRLTDRFPQGIGPIVAIMMSTTYFAIGHADSVHVLGVFPLGVWLGVVAWRCRSTLPAIFCHITNNLVAVLEAHFMPSDQFGVSLSPFMIGVMVVSGGAFFISLGLLFREPRFSAAYDR